VTAKRGAAQIARTGGTLWRTESPTILLTPSIVGRHMAVISALYCEDWQDIRAVRILALTDAPEAFTSPLERELTYDEAKWRDLALTSQWFVADDDELVGVAVGVRGWSGDPTKRELVGMWVASSRRRSGIARRLLDQVKAWAASEGRPH